MKKIFALLLAFVFVFSFSACGQKGDKLVPIVENETVTLKAQENVFPESTVVTAEKVTEGENYTTAANALKKSAQKFEIYNITAKSDNVSVQPNGKVEATFDIPEGFDTDLVSVIYISDSGKIEYIPSVVNKEKNTVTAELSHFSIYAVIEENPNVPDNTQSDATASEKAESEKTSSVESTPEVSSKPNDTNSKVSDTKPTVVCMHKYPQPECAERRTCSLCHEVSSAARDHVYTNGICELCKKSDPNFKALTSGTWSVNIVADGQLNAITLYFKENPRINVGIGDNVANMDKEAQEEFKKPEYADSIHIIDGVTYYVGRGFIPPFTFTENGDTVVITEEESTNTLTLKRHSATEYKVTDMKGDFCGTADIIKVNTIFTYDK